MTRNLVASTSSCRCGDERWNVKRHSKSCLGRPVHAQRRREGSDCVQRAEPARERLPTMRRVRREGRLYGRSVCEASKPFFHPGSHSAAPWFVLRFVPLAAQRRAQAAAAWLHAVFDRHRSRVVPEFTAKRAESAEDVSAIRSPQSAIRNWQSARLSPRGGCGYVQSCQSTSCPLASSPSSAQHAVDLGRLERPSGQRPPVPTGRADQYRRHRHQVPGP